MAEVRIEPWGVDFEYPKGHAIQCNDWCVELSDEVAGGEGELTTPR